MLAEELLSAAVSHRKSGVAAQHTRMESGDNFVLERLVATNPHPIGNMNDTVKQGVRRTGLSIH
jgi:hypothetical protein